MNDLPTVLDARDDLRSDLRDTEETAGPGGTIPPLAADPIYDTAVF